MIVVMGVPEKGDYDDNVLVDVYDEIIRLAADPESLDRIARSSTYEQLFLQLTETLNHTKKG